MPSRNLITKAMEREAADTLLRMWAGGRTSWKQVAIRIQKANGLKKPPNRGLLSAIANRKKLKVPPSIIRWLGIKYTPLRRHDDGWLPPRKVERLRNAALIVLLLFILESKGMLI